MLVSAAAAGALPSNRRDLLLPPTVDLAVDATLPSRACVPFAKACAVE